ncbi:MAG TPA: hypothetical protein VM784_10915 [Actinomycetota bacterium]|nr:hypothetical protein [Actinomycetota bacterium]
MEFEAVLEVPVRLARVARPSQQEADLYPSTFRSILLAWQASRLGDLLDDPTRVRVVGRETGARM